jgi:hypothetical protein
MPSFIRILPGVVPDFQAFEAGVTPLLFGDSIFAKDQGEPT